MKNYWAKGQLISKCLFDIFNSPKKRTKKFDFTTMVPQVELFSFVFWENWRHFKINWPLNGLGVFFYYFFPLLQVTFLNEPGEGSGVARGFYTALAEAVLTNTRLPNLDLAQAVASGSTASLTAAASKSMQFSLIQRLRGTRDPSRLGRSSSSTSGSGSKSSSSRTAREISRLSFDARSFVMNGNF